MKEVNLHEIKKAYEIISQYIINSPLKKSLTLSQIFECDIFLKV